jgi:hypothetical protein
VRVRIQQKETGHENAGASRSGSSFVNRHDYHCIVRGWRLAAAYVFPGALHFVPPGVIVVRRYSFFRDSGPSGSVRFHVTVDGP